MARSGVMLAYPFNLQAIIKRWSWPIIVQPKYNGFRGRSEYGDGYRLLSSESNEFNSVPHINKALNQQLGTILPDGEIYQHGRSLTGPNGVNSVVKRKLNLHPDSAQMEYHIFDIINERKQEDRLAELAEVKLKWPLIKVSVFYAYSLEELYEICGKMCCLGYEGIILRQPYTYYTPRKVPFMMKLKPTKDDHYKIINFREEISIENVPKNRLGSVQCIDTKGSTFWVGSGFDAFQRENLWKNPKKLIGQFCHVKYQELTTRGVPVPPVVLDIVDTNPEAANSLD